MVDMQSATAEIRRGEKRRKIVTSGKIVCPHLLGRATIKIPDKLGITTNLSRHIILIR